MADHEDSASRPHPASAGVARTLTIAGHEIDSRALLAGSRELIIVHGAERYRLRLTSQNKLILTK